MDDLELIVINKWKKWGKNEFVYLWIYSGGRLDDMTGDTVYQPDFINSNQLLTYLSW